MDTVVEPNRTPARKRVLVVDDEPAIISLLVRAFRKHFDVVTASNGERALDILRSSTDFDVIMLDFAMPGMNGVEVAKLAFGLAPTTVRILATAHYELPEVKSALANGTVTDVIPKPWTPTEVIARVKRWTSAPPPA